MSEKPAPDIIDLAIEIVVGVLGIALIFYLKANYSEAIGSWILSFF